jgi:hypothetical protein
MRSDLFEDIGVTSVSLFYYPEEESRFLSNVGKHLQEYKAPRTRKQKFS